MSTENCRFCPHRIAHGKMGHVERHNDSYMCPVCRELKDAENQKRFAEYRQRKALEPPTELEKVTAERDALQVENHRKSTLLGNIAVEYTGLSNSNHYGEYFKSLIALAFAEIEDSPSTQEGE